MTDKYVELDLSPVTPPLPDPDVDPVHEDIESPRGSWKQESPADDETYESLIETRHEGSV